MCCGVLELPRRIKISHGDFGSPSKWGFDSGEFFNILNHPNFASPFLPLFIAEEVKRAIQEQHCTGMEISKAPVA